MLEQLVEQLEREGFFEQGNGVDENESIFNPQQAFNQHHPRRILLHRKVIEKLSENISRNISVGNFSNGLVGNINASQQNLNQNSRPDGFPQLNIKAQHLPPPKKNKDTKTVQPKPKSVQPKPKTVQSEPKPDTGYTWNPINTDNIQAFQVVIAQETYTPLQNTTGNTNQTDSAVHMSQNPIASTYVAQPYHSEILKPGQVLSVVQIAELVFPEDNNTTDFSFGFHAGKDQIAPLNIKGGNSDIMATGISNPNIEEISKNEMDIDIGVAELKNTTTRRVFYQEGHMYAPTQNKMITFPMAVFVREEKSYKAIQVYGGGGVEEERNVYIENVQGIGDLLVTSQYRIGVIVGKDKDIIPHRLSVGAEVQFNTPWINNPIPEQKESIPTIRSNPINE